MELRALDVNVTILDRPASRAFKAGTVIYILIALLLVSACSSQPAQVVNREQPPSRKIQHHRVNPGETLYSIAWRYDIDHRQLARHNGISPPFTIYPGQMLQLDVGNASAPTAEPPAAIARQSKPPEKAGTRSKNQTRSAPAQKAPSLITGAPQWRWPVKGRVLSAFGASTGLNQGIDIDGNLGDSVVAAAAGQVVYAGNGLRGYGNLVIIKHNDTFLSAYAHNRRLRVSEGDSVKAGEVIAEMGSTGTDSVRLHFEIRRDGKPVDPIGYLPKR